MIYATIRSKTTLANVLMNGVQKILSQKDMFGSKKGKWKMAILYGYQNTVTNMTFGERSIIIQVYMQKSDRQSKRKE